MQAQVLVACKVVAAHSLKALTSFVHGYYNCQLSGVAVAVVAAIAIAAAGLVVSS